MSGHQVPHMEQTPIILHPQYNRGIPKAVDSLCGWSKEEYKDFPMVVDPKKRKRMPGMARELRQSKNPSYDEDADDDNSKRRVRGGKDDQWMGMAPKLKIKFQAAMIQSESMEMTMGGGSGGGINSLDTSAIGGPGGSASLASTMASARPPKKRLSNTYVPSFEDLKRDSMNFRKMVMADFDEKKVKTKEKKAKKTKTPKEPGDESKKEEKRKKKKEKKREKLEVLNAEPSTGPKLIIRIGKSRPEKGEGGAVTPPKDAESNNNVLLDATAAAAEATASTEINDTSAGAAAVKNVMPIRLKIARNSVGYVMAEKEGKNGESGSNGGGSATKGGASEGKRGKTANAAEEANDPSAASAKAEGDGKDETKKAGDGGGAPAADVSKGAAPSIAMNNKECEVR